MPWGRRMRWADGMGQVEQKARGTGAGGTAVAKARIQRGAARKQDQEPGACPDAHTPLAPKQTGNKRTLRTWQPESPRSSALGAQTRVGGHLCLGQSWTVTRRGPTSRQRSPSVPCSWADV